MKFVMIYYYADSPIELLKQQLYTVFGTVFSMLSLGSILIPALVVADLFMHQLFQ